MDVTQLFSTPIVITQIDLSYAQSEKLVYGLQVLSASYNDRSIRTAVQYIPGHDIITDAVYQSLHALAPHCKWSICSIKLNEMTNGAVQRFHMHRDVDAFSILYLTTADNGSGSLILQDPRFVDHATLDPKTTTHSIPCIRGTLVTAPSYVWHSVDPYYGTSSRYSIVYNAVAERSDDA